MKLLLNSPKFEYDIRGLLQSFLPWEKFETDPAAPDADFLRVTYEENALRATILFSHGGKEKSDTVTFSGNPATEKTELKRALYVVLSAVMNRTLPWGTLSGIRPTKIATALRHDGFSDDEIRRHMEEELLVSPEKTALALDVSAREEALLQQSGPDGFSLYVGIPFCPSTCVYCSFSAYTISDYADSVGDYLAALEKELIAVSRMTKGRTLRSVYFGGGTPTSITPEDMDFLLTTVETHFDVSRLLELTVEAGRPETLTDSMFAVLKKHPVTRLSINPQTLHQKTLDLIGRNHTVEDFYQAFRKAREKGFLNINTDLILGLPGETGEDVAETIRKIAELRPESVTIHSLAVKRSSRLNREKEKYRCYRMENPEETMALCYAVLKDAGLAPYYLYRQKNMAGNLENVGFTVPGRESYYNVFIMEETETIFACGAGAVTKKVDGTKIDRAPNVHDVKTYIANIDEMIERKRKLFSESEGETK